MALAGEIAASGCATVIGVDWDGYASDGGPACVVPATDCSLTGNACVEAVCQDGTCVQRPVPEGTPCAEEGGGFCDGRGACFERCNGGPLCPADACESSTCRVTCGTPDGVSPTPLSCLAGNLREWALDGVGNFDAYLVPCIDRADVSITDQRSVRGGSFAGGAGACARSNAGRTSRTPPRTPMASDARGRLDGG